MSWSRSARGAGACVIAALIVGTLSGCGFLRDFKGANSVRLPGVEGGAPGSYTVQAELPDVMNLQPNSRVRVNDVTVGTVTNVELKDWHALVTLRLNGDVDLPANATAAVGLTSILGSLHLELAPPKDAPPQGKLKDGSLIPLSSGSAFPSTEQTLAALSLVLNGGGISHLQDITTALSVALSDGRGEDLRSLLGELDTFVGNLEDQTDDIIAATESLDKLVGKFADQKPVLDRALKTIPRAVTVLKDERDNLVDALDQVGKFGALAADAVNQTKENLVKELKDLGPVLQSLADAGPALTRSLDFFSTFPFPKPTLTKWVRGDYANLTAVIDLTLSRIDAALFTGTRWECHLTWLELQWGRTIGQQPSPCMAGGPNTPGNPLVAPYRFDQGK